MAIYRYRYAVFEGYSYITSFIWSLLRSMCYQVHIIFRSICWVFKIAAFMGQMPYVLVHGVRMFFSSYHWNVVLSSIFHAVCSGFQIPLSPRSDNFHIRSQCFDGEFKTNLVITFTSRTVSNSISAFFFSNIYEDFTNQRSSEGCT